ncbi:MAG TPA: hypothetical protein VFV87_03530 [Pirellulaceae bacterium]|nr:hypothetical protein [Pirellulaceae bacterium]
MAIWLVAASVSTSEAEPPRVHFDMPFAVACADVTSPQFAAANPGQKLIEARLEISSLLVAGKERDLTQYFVRFESPQRTLTVVDYLPKTLHESRHAGPISVQDTDEKNASIGINLAGQYEMITGAGINAGLGHKNVSCVKQDLLPPLETVAASGTLLRGTAVYFKLKSSPRNLLEGAREYALVLRVPCEWRADYVHVRCQAEGIERAFVSSLDQQVTCGQRDFLVALYLEGDPGARDAAEQFSRREAQLRTSAQATEKGSETPSRHTAARNRPPRTDDWLPRLLYGPAAQLAALPSELPQQVQQAVRDFAAARSDLEHLSGRSAQPPTGLAQSQP